MTDPPPDAPLPHPEAADAGPVEITEEERQLVAEAPTLCLNCGARLPGAYCPRCGQRAQSLRVPAHRFVRDALSELFGLDGRVWKTYGTLLFRPGRLTVDYLKGRRQRSLSPLRVYLAATLLFFVLLSMLDPIGQVSDAFGARPDGRDGDTLVVVREELARVLRRAATSDSLAARSSAAVRDTAVAVRSALAASRAADSLAQAREVAAAESTLAALAAGPGDAAAVREAERARDDAREELADRLRELDEEREEAVEDALDRVDAGLSASDRLALGVEAAILRALPPDSLVRLGDIESARAQVVPEITNGFGLPEWLPQSGSLERFRRARDRTEQRAATIALGRDAIARVPTALFLLLPLFALLLKLVYVRRDWYYSEHLVFGLHVHAAAFVVLTGALVVSALSGGGGVHSGASSVGSAAVTGLLLYIPVYYLVAAWRVYRQGVVKTLAKSVVVGSLYGMALLVLGLTLTMMLTVVGR